MEDTKTRLVFFVNGAKVEDAVTDPRMTLANYLRRKLNLVGTKIGCNEGGCGACTVMVSEIDHLNGKKIKHFSANACLTPIGRVHGRHVTTVEGIGSVRRKLHSVQERLSKGHGSQCGFCTPGFVMAMYALLRENPIPSTEEVEEALQGNLCRCTGYRPILESFYSFCGKGAACCKNNTDSTVDGDQKLCLTEFSECRQYDPTQEPIFPPDLQLQEYDREELVLRRGSAIWYRPRSLSELIRLKSIHPDAKIIQGCSEIGVEMKFRFADYQCVIDPSGIDELKEIRVLENGIVVGSCVTLADLKRFLAQTIDNLPGEKTRLFSAVHTMLHWFAGKHIRNTATWAGNLMTASPISDLNPLFMAANGSRVLVESLSGGKRYVNIDDKFFVGYRRTAVKSEEVVLQLELPYTSEDEFFYGYKQAQRREDDIAIVNSGMYVQFEHGTRMVKNVRISFGGMAPTTILAKKTMDRLIGRTWNTDLMNDALKTLLSDVALPPGVPGGMEKFRQTLCLSFFFKFFHNVNAHSCGVPRSQFGDDPHHRGPMYGTQIFRDIPSGSAAFEDPVGRPIAHLSGEKHTTGEAMYCDDEGVAGALHMAFVLSQKGHAVIKRIDASPALALDGVVDVVGHRDIPEDGTNQFGVCHDQLVFAVDEVLHFGQVIAAVVAVDPEIARKAAELVKIDYEELPVILTIQDAIRNNSYLGRPWSIHSDSCELDADWMVEGNAHMGGQEHFYLEPQACIVTPGEDDEMDVLSSTQNPTEVQLEVSRVLGIPANKVVAHVKRIGGGFGGKETAMMILILPAAVAAYKLRKPIRVCLERFDDMAMTGTRHPYFGQYKLALRQDGKFLAYDLDMYANCGYSYDLSLGVMHRALLHADSVYRLPMSVCGRLCKTNFMSSTAFRGFGAPQGMFLTECCIVDAAYTMGIEPEKLREMNMYEEGDQTPWGQKLENCNAKRCWNECVEMSRFWQRRREIDEWNKHNRWTKRGIALIPTKFGCAFGILSMNQAGALVHIYRDGSVLVSHAGMEMGQGLHTKIVQIASRALGIPHPKITIRHTSTDKVPNTSPTAGSVGSDLNGMAVKEACDTLKHRLEPVIAANPKGSWENWIQEAYQRRISLSTTGFYKTDMGGMDYESGKGEPYNYFVYGAACTEVEIDCLTGDHRMKRTDIVMDVGDSLNPAVDIGQIEGAFIQGYGLFTMEELKISPKGILYTRGPGTYKIPSADDVPRHFNVKLLKGSSNKKAVFSSKAVGEPPLFLGSSAFFAIKDAIKASREENGVKGPFQLDSPATPERIRLACQDPIADMVAEPKPGTYMPWNVRLELGTGDEWNWT